MIIRKAWPGAGWCRPLSIYELELPEDTTWVFIGWEQGVLPRETRRVLT